MINTTMSWCAPNTSFNYRNWKSQNKKVKQRNFYNLKQFVGIQRYKKKSLFSLLLKKKSVKTKKGCVNLDHPKTCFKKKKIKNKKKKRWEGESADVTQHLADAHNIPNCLKLYIESETEIKV